MEGKIIGMLVAFAIIVAGAGWVLNSQSAADIRSHLVDARSSIDSYQRSIESLELQNREQDRTLKDLETDAANIDRLKSRQAELTARIDQLKKHSTEMTNAALFAASELNDLVIEQRRLAIGTVTPELVLKSGKKLTSAKIQKINEDVISVSHSNGVARLRLHDLNAKWAEQFQIADPPTAPASKPEGTADANTTETPPEVVSAVPAPSRRPADPNRVKELKEKIGRLDAQIHIYRASQESWMSKSREIKAKVVDSESKGRIVTNKSRIDEAQNNAHLNEQKAAELEAEEIRLRSELYSLNGY